MKGYLNNENNKIIMSSYNILINLIFYGFISQLFLFILQLPCFSLYIHLNLFHILQIYVIFC